MSREHDRKPSAKPRNQELPPETEEARTDALRRAQMQRAVERRGSDPIQESHR